MAITSLPPGTAAAAIGVGVSVGVAVIIRLTLRTADANHEEEKLRNTNAEQARAIDELRKLTQEQDSAINSLQQRLHEVNATAGREAVTAEMFANNADKDGSLHKRRASAAAALTKAVPAKTDNSGTPGRTQTWHKAADEWEENSALTLPNEMWLQNATAALGQVGPLVIAQRNVKEQCEELRKTLATGRKFSVDLYIMSRLEHHLIELEKEQASLDARLEAAIAGLNDVAHASAAAIAPRMVSDRGRYTACLNWLIASEPKMLEKVAALGEELANTGALTEGEIVEVVADEGVMKRAKVLRAEGGDEYTVSVWNQYAELKNKYEAGYETRHPIHRTIARKRIHANGQLVQQLSPAAQSRWRRRCTQRGMPPNTPVDPKSLDAHLLLYVDAEATLVNLDALKARVRRELSSATVAATDIVIAPLKGLQRSAINVLEKYERNYLCQTDLARMTFACSKLSHVHELLCVVGTLGDEYELLRIKNWLTKAFDAEVSGGYRDMLLNMRCRATGHIFEVQVTLSTLLAVKSSGGHAAAYALARTLKLFTPEIFQHEGALSERVVKGIASGMVRVLRCRSPASALATHFDALLAALRAPSCVLQELTIEGCDWPAGRPLSELLDCLCGLGGLLTTLNVASMDDCVGQLTPAFFASCTKLKHCGFYLLKNLTGPIPSSIGQLKDLHTVWMTGSQLDGTLPITLGDCDSLERFWVLNNRISGRVPAQAFAGHRNMTELGLEGNEGLGVTPSTQKAILEGTRLKDKDLTYWPAVVTE